MDESRFTFLQRLVASPSPSGFEQPAQAVVRAEVQQFADEVRTDVMGNVIAALNPTGMPRVMLTAHCDELGFLIRYIDERGFLYFSTIGGFDPSTLPGERVYVHTPAGPLLGVLGRKPIHLMEGKEREQAPDLKEMWIDIGVESKAEAQKLVPLGCVATRANQLEHLRGDLVVSRGMDNKSSILTIMETMRLLHAQRDQLKAAVFFVSSVQEEIGGNGAALAAHGIDPQIALTVDVTFGSDHPQTTEVMLGDVKLGGGPTITTGAFVSPRIFQLLTEAAKAADMAYQLDLQARRTSTDNDSVRLTHAGIATGLLNIPCRYMHSSSEVVSLKDIEQTGELMARFVLALDEKTDLIPQ
ncbi:MAG: M20/M25/M40 family metallo-hydrolase [Ktedonobacteraceae bacterium]